MPVSPQDFELYSRMTGAPMPTDAMSRMQMAPEVFKFTKDFAKKPNILEKTGNLIKTVGKIGLMGLGEGYRQSQANEQRAIEEQLRNKAATTQSQAVTMDDPVEEVVSEPLTSSEKAEIAKQKTADLRHSQKMEQMAVAKQDALDLLAAKVKSVQEPTTADAFGQDRIENQTSSKIIDRKMEQGSQIADSTPNIAEVLSESQDSIPVDESFPVGDARRNMRSVEEIEKNLQEDMETASLTRIGGPEGGVGKNQLAKFLSQKGLDQALLGAIGERMTPEPRIGDSSPLLDHPDVIGGEDDASLPSGTNTSPTQNLSSFHKEMRKMEAMERNKGAIDEVVDKFKNMSPSERQTMLGTEGMDSPNEMQGRITAAEESSNKLIDAMRSMKGDPTQEQFVEVSQAGSRAEQKIAAKQRLRGIKTPLTEKFYPTDVPRTDIQVGGMVDRKTGLGKSVGISYTPMNGDTKVGFNIMSDPTKPTEVSTFDFVAPPETMESMESRGEEDLGSKTFGKLFNIARQKKQGFSGLEM